MYQITTPLKTIDVKTLSQAIALVKSAITLGVDVSVSYIKEPEKDGKKSV